MNLIKLLFLALLVLAHSDFALAYTFDDDVPQNLRDEIKRDMGFIGTIQGGAATPLHKQIFGAVDGPKYVEFFESRVSAVGLDDCGDGKAVACVMPGFDPSKIWLTPNYVKFSHPQVAKMMIVFHESRHTEVKNGNWMHATCPTPFLDDSGQETKSIWTGFTLAGEAACDITPLGSYGSSTIMLKNIQKFCKNCSDKVKMDAGLYADDQYHRITGEDAKQEMKKDLYSLDDSDSLL